MEKVIIKRMKRNKRKPTLAEKLFAAAGLGSTLLSGAGAVAPKTSSTRFVRVMDRSKSSAASDLGDRVNRILGVRAAKAASDAPPVFLPGGTLNTAGGWRVVGNQIYNPQFGLRSSLDGAVVSADPEVSAQSADSLDSGLESVGSEAAAEQAGADGPVEAGASNDSAQIADLADLADSDLETATTEATEGQVSAYGSVGASDSPGVAQTDSASDQDLETAGTAATEGGIDASEATSSHDSLQAADSLDSDLETETGGSATEQLSVYGSAEAAAPNDSVQTDGSLDSELQGEGVDAAGEQVENGAGADADSLQQPAGGANLRMKPGYLASSGLKSGNQLSASGAQTYTVKKGDTLWAISARYYGDGRNWRRILEANPNALSIPGDTRTLRVGAVLTIPELPQAASESAA